MELPKLCNHFFIAGQEARRNGRGLERWNEESSKFGLDKNGPEIAKWIWNPPKLTPDPKILEAVSISPEEYQHFLDQVARMPAREPANRARLVQLFYNLGQLYDIGDTRLPSNTEIYFK